MRLIIVPVVNGLDLTRACIESCLRQDVPDIHVLAIDNGSHDGVQQYLQSIARRNVTVIRHHKPRSLHTVWNTALDDSFRRMWFGAVMATLVINNDVILRTDTYRLLEEDGGDFVTGVAVGSIDQMNDVNVASRSPHPSFSCFLIRKQAWQKTGKFDERYWAYCGDLDYHIRMHRAGVKAYAIGLPFYHVGSATMRNASNVDRDALQLKADADRATFHAQYGFATGSPEYYECFKSPSQKGAPDVHQSQRHA